MNRARRTWRRLLAGRPIVTRLVLGFVAAMAVVLVASSAFVYWRVEYALNRQLDQDLAGYEQVVRAAVAAGDPAPSGTLGETYQVYDVQGRVVAGDRRSGRLVPAADRDRALTGDRVVVDVGGLLPVSARAYRIAVSTVRSPTGPVVVAAGLSRHKHDEALRELMLQLAIANLLALAAASFVGYRVARAALDPVEEYRRSAAAVGDDVERRLPVAEGRDDEVTRLGHTLNALLARIEAARVRERQLLADASHELRTPLSLMRAELDWVLHRRRTPEELQTTLESMRGQVERMVDLANALLDLEELRSGEGLVTAAVDLHVLVDDVLAGFPAAACEGRRLVNAVPAECVVVSDRWLALAITNLVVNALRHGAGTVEVGADVRQDKVELWVGDEGEGFADDFVGVAFDRFARADSSRSSAGSGLGLALVKAVAEAHGGNARVDTARRARVVVSLPR